MMNIARKLCVFTLCLMSVAAWGQTERNSIEIDYENAKKYVLGGVSVEGNTYFSSEQIIQQTGLVKGMEITVPGEDISNIVNRLWAQRYFEDVAISLDSLSSAGDSARGCRDGPSPA